jgi:citronellol/citronellal dehydrogenase
VRDEAQVDAFVAAAAEHWGGIDVVVNNASAINLSPIAEPVPKRYDLMLDINVRGTYLLTGA